MQPRIPVFQPDVTFCALRHDVLAWASLEPRHAKKAHAHMARNCVGDDNSKQPQEAVGIGQGTGKLTTLNSRASLTDPAAQHPTHDGPLGSWNSVKAPVKREHGLLPSCSIFQLSMPGVERSLVSGEVPSRQQKSKRIALVCGLG